jgi:hypothetical protein
MSQISSTIQAQTVPQVREPGRRFLVATGLLIATAAIVFVVARTTAPASTAGLRTGEAVDGWMSGLAAERANIAANSTTDGFLPGLMDTRRQYDPGTDTSPAAVAAESGGDSVDGYLPGLIAAHQVGNVTDGWEAGIGFRQAPRSITTDGWEAGLR